MATPFRYSLIFAVLLQLLLNSFTSSLKAQSPDSEPLPPEIADASQEATDAMSSFKIPAGWKIELFAAEPDVANIVAFDIDNLGRIFACESFRQNKGVTDNRGHDEVWLKRDLAAQTVQDRIDYHLELLGEEAKQYKEQDDRIRLLVDTNGDGKADQSTVYADHFNQLEDGTGAGVLARGNSVYFTNIPKLYQLVDRDGDGKSDERIVMSDGYGVRVAFRGHDMHGLVIGPDGRLYFSIGDRGYHVMTNEGKLLHDPTSGAVFRCELDGSNLEVFAQGLRNPQELAFNDYGDLFTGDNNSDSGDKARLVHVLRGGDTGWRMYYQYLPDRGPFNRDKIWEPFHDTQPAYIVPPITNFGDGPSGFTFYPGTGFGDELADTFLLADFRGGPANSGIRAFKLEPDGAFYALAEDSQKVWSILATDVAFGPDGALYISDWVNGWNGEGKGRIYRLTDPQFADSTIVKEVQSLLAGDWSAYESSSLLQMLNHRDRRVRFESQWELAKRKEIQAFLDFAADNSNETIPRLHAIWGVGQILRISNTAADERLTSVFGGLLDDNDAFIRAAAAQCAGNNASIADNSKLVSLLSDESSRVRYFAAMAVADRGNSQAFDSAVQMLAENDNRDPALRHAGIMALAKIAEADVIADLVGHPSANVRRAAVVALRKLNASQVSRFLQDGDVRVAGEAVRAIHDAPVQESMSALAALASRPISDVEIARRVLNANYRLGTPENATAVAEMAGRSTVPESVRIEALQMLAKWATPDERDWILNDWRPLPQRNPITPAEALKANLASILSGSEKVRDLAISVAADLGINEISPLLVERLDNPNLAAAARASALRAMAQLNPEDAVKRSEAILSESDAATDLRVAAIKVLQQMQPDRTAELLIASAASTKAIAEQQAAWDAISDLKLEATLPTLRTAVSDWIAGKTAPETSLNILEAVDSSGSKELQDAVSQHLAEISRNDPLATWKSALVGGNSESGEVIFFTKTELSCVRCHKVGSQGGEVGPDLTQIAKDKDRKYLLESIVFPDAQIAKGFETTVLADDLGTVHTGIVKSEDEETIVLIKADGSQVRIFKDEIVSRRRGQSAMPSDLTKYMSKRELRDLVAYLTTLDHAIASDEGGHQVE